MASYPWSATVHDDHAPGSPEERLRLWYQTRALCGDVIVELGIHALDVAAWFAGAHPIKAVGTCSRVTRKYGDMNSHFAVIYLTDPQSISNPQIRAHALEGQLFRSVLIEAVEAHGLSCSVVLERETYTKAATTSARSENNAKRVVAGL